VVEKNIDEVCVDHKNLIVTTPAYMYDKATALEVYLGIGKMVTAVNELLRS
jgi:enhancing lycopene biosynthesis protein 2